MAEELAIVISAKDEATKKIRAIDKEIAKLVKQKAEIPVELDAEGVEKQAKELDDAIEKLEKRKVEIELDAKVDDALSALDDIITREKKVEEASEALARALGPELTAKADVTSIISDFERMGFSLDEITARADQLGGKLRSIGEQSGGNLDATLSRARQGVDDIGKSADSSKSAMANMVGNASQDMGELAGVTGSTGVAIGQMAEYIADAALAGEGLGSVFKNFALVAGPIAAISAVIGIVSGTMQQNEERAQKAAEATKAYGDAMSSSANDAVGLTAVLRDNTEEMQNFDAAATDTGGILKEVFSNAPLIGGLFKDAPTDVVETLNDIEVGFFKVGKAIGGNVLAWNEIRDTLTAYNKAGIITDKQLEDAIGFLNEQRDAVKNAEEAQQFHNIALGEASALYDEIIAKKEPLEQFPEVWTQVFDAIRNGTLDSQEATDAINRLAFELGLDPNEVISTALEEVDRQQQENIQTGKEWADQQEKNRQAAADYATGLGEAQTALDELADATEQATIKGDALADSFDAVNEPLERLGDTRDIDQGMRDLRDFLNEPVEKIAELNDKIDELRQKRADVKVGVDPASKQKAAEDIADIDRQIADLVAERAGLQGQLKIPNIFDPNDVNADDFLAKIQSLRDPIQQQIQQVFADSGAPAAAATAENFVNQLYATLGGKLSKAQIRTLLGLDDLDVTLKIAVDKSALENAKRELEILAGIPGANPVWQATIGLALQEGTISPQAAKILVERQLRNAGVEIPTKLATPDTGPAKAEADRWAAQPGHAVDFLAELDNTSQASKQNSYNDAQNWAYRNTVHYPSVIDPPTGGQTSRSNLPWWMQPRDGGGRVGRRQLGLVAERRPEIVDGKYLVTEPTVVPPGTRVTSGRRTARILKARGVKLRNYDVGGTVVAGPSTVNINFNGVGAIGNRYDLMRTVTRANLDKTRLLGTRS